MEIDAREMVALVERIATLSRTLTRANVELTIIADRVAALLGEGKPDGRR